MAGFRQNPERVNNLRYAVRQAKDGEMVTLTELAKVWGTSKQRFITTKKDIEEKIGFPTYEKSKRGNDHLYPAKPALQAMLDYEQRDEKTNKARQARIDRLVAPQGRGEVDDASSLSLQDLIQVNRLQAEIEAREREQREYIRADDVQRVTGIIFAQVSTFVSEITSVLDPNGELTGEQRRKLDERGREALLGMHAEIKGLLTSDGDKGSTARSGRKVGGAKRARPPRKRH